eukprot:SAG31_NODE_6638_length_1943_cov_1.436009_1_plen_82_part_00
MQTDPPPSEARLGPRWSFEFETAMEAQERADSPTGGFTSTGRCGGPIAPARERGLGGSARPEVHRDANSGTIAPQRSLQAY